LSGGAAGWARDCGDMDHGLGVANKLQSRPEISKINGFMAPGRAEGRGDGVEPEDFVTLFTQGPGDVSPEKSARSGDDDGHSA
jgi:hypothetical protein